MASSGTTFPAGTNRKGQQLGTSYGSVLTMRTACWEPLRTSELGHHCFGPASAFGNKATPAGPSQMLCGPQQITLVNAAYHFAQDCRDDDRDAMEGERSVNIPPHHSNPANPPESVDCCRRC